MHLNVLAFYTGPDQIMGLTSGLASLMGLLLIFWNKLGGLYFKVTKVFRRSSQESTTATAGTPTENA